MDKKLTLKLEQKVIEKAKKYASDKQISLSRMIESYLKSLFTENKTSDFEISPFIKSISTGVNIPLDIDYKNDYSNHLINKYK